MWKASRTVSSFLDLKRFWYIVLPPIPQNCALFAILYFIMFVPIEKHLPVAYLYIYCHKDGNGPMLMLWILFLAAPAPPYTYIWDWLIYDVSIHAHARTFNQITSNFIYKENSATTCALPKKTARQCVHYGHHGPDDHHGRDGHHGQDGHFGRNSVGDTQSVSIQCLNFAKKWFIQYLIQYCVTQDSIQNIIQLKKTCLFNSKDNSIQ